MKKIIAVGLVIVASLGSLFGQQHTENKPDQVLRGSGRINPSSLGVEIDIPLGNYPGRGINVPIGLSYSSKVWRTKYVDSFPQVNNPENCIRMNIPKFSERSTGGWSTSLAVPYIEYTGKDDIYDIDGRPAGSDQSACDGETNPLPLTYVPRVTVHLPGGETHELRASDALDQFPASSGPSFNFDRTFYAVDGSNIRYIEDSSTDTYKLLLPDGSYYLFNESTVQEDQKTIRKAETYSDRNGNSTTYHAPTSGYPNGYWTDTLGRTLAIPFGDGTPTTAGIQEYSVPGMGESYKLNWKLLKGSTAGESAITDFSATLQYKADRSSADPNSTPRSGALFTSGYSQWVHDAGAPVFNPLLLAEIELPTGQKYKFTYDVYGRLERIYYPTGGEERFEYDVIPMLGDSEGGEDINAQTNFGVVNRKLYVTAGQGTPLEWTYDASHSGPNGYLVSMTAPDGVRSDRYIYRSPDSGSSFGYESPLAGMPYDERVYSSTDALVSQKLTTWDKTNLNITITNTGGTYTFSSNAGWHPRVTQVESRVYDASSNGVSTTTTFEYDGDLADRDDPLLQKKSSQYAFVTVGSSLPSNPVRVSENTFLINDSAYSSVKSNYTAQNIFGLVTASQIKDGSGIVVSRTETVFDESGRSPGYRGNPTTAKVWDSTKGAVTSSGAYISTSAKFDSYGNQYEATDARGCTTATTFDSTYHAFPIQVTSCTPSDGTYGSSSAFTTTATFDATTGLPLTTTDANGLTTAIEYDDNTSRPLNTKTYNGSTQVGNTVETEYHDEANNYWVKNRTQIDTNLWAETKTYFDGLGRAWKTEETNSNGNIFVEKEFDGDGRVLRVSNPFRSGETKVWTTNSYDEAGRIDQVTLQDGSTVTTDYGVSISGVIGVTKQITDQAGKKRKGISDALGRMVRVIEDPTGQNLSTDYVFDTLGNLRKTTQGDQNRYFIHDSLGRLLYAKQPEQETNSSFTATDPVTGNTAWSVKYEYDDNANITKTTDARGIYVEGTYDNFNRLKTRNYSDSTPDVSFYYDGKGLSSVPDYSKGKTTKVTSLVSETQYTSFDVLGRTLQHKQITDGTTYVTSYDYNLSGGLVSETYPSGLVINYSLNSDGDLSRVYGINGSATTTYANSFNYNVNGSVDKMRLGNGRWETSLYNTRGQVTQIALGMGSSGTGLLKLNYDYGTSSQNNGSLREQKINYSGLASEIKQTYTYDDLNRLASATEVHNTSTQSWKETFSYDRYGNRTFDTSNNNTTTLSQSASWKVTNPTILTSNNRLKEDQDNNSVLDYDYDAAGNLILDAENKRFVYDAENHQTQFFGSSNSGSTPDATYYYDGDGRRVKKISSTETTVFVYNASGTLVAEYSTDLAATPRTSYLTTDHLGSPRVVTDQLGAVVSRHDYTGFGKDIAETLGATTGGRTSAQGYGAADEVRKQYTGYERDDELGLEFAQARYYNGDHGRFTSTDPLMASADIKNPQTFNRYSYVLNSPYKYVDPLGLISSSTGACGQWCQGNDGGSTAFYENSNSGWVNGVDVITIDLNIVYDAGSFSLSEVQENMKPQLKDLEDTFGRIGINFNVTYAAGTSNESRTEIMRGAVEGSLNVFYYDDRNKHKNWSEYNTGTRQIFMLQKKGMELMSAKSLSHEIGHAFGILGSITSTAASYLGSAGNNLITNTIDNVTSDAQINTANAWLRNGLAVYGRDWVDDYRTALTTTKTLRNAWAVAKAGAEPRYDIKSTPRTPTVLDLYRSGAREIATQKSR